MEKKHCEDACLKHREAAVRRVDAERRLLDFVASTSEPDRVDEVVVTQGIDTTAYLRNPTLLVDHNVRVPLGRVVALGVSRLGVHDALVGTAEVLPPGTSQQADQAWAEIQAGARNGISISFIALDADPPGTPRRAIRRSELLEISSVTMPACRGCTVIGTSGAKGLSLEEQTTAVIEEYHRGREKGVALMTQLAVRDYEKFLEKQERPYAYKFVLSPRIARAAKRFACWACEELGIPPPPVKLFRKAGAGESADFRVEHALIGAYFHFPDYTIAVDGSLGPEQLAETVAHEVMHAAGGDETAAERFSKEFVAGTYRKMVGSGPRAGRPSPGMTYDEKGAPRFEMGQDQTQVIVTCRTF